MSKLIENKKISIFVFPLVLSFWLDIFLWASLFITKSIYLNKTATISAFVLLMWITLFVVEQRKNDEEKNRLYVNSNIVIICFISVLFSAYFCTIIWRSGYLSLNPVGAVNEGTQHLDTLLHSAIAESYKYSFIPSTLINDCAGVKYHTFSHLLMSGISSLTGIPCFICYNFFYPVVFLPIYLFLQFACICQARGYFNSPLPGNIQLLIVFLANIGLFSEGAKIGVGHSSFLVSESFNIALSLLYLYVIIAFSLLTGYKYDKVQRILKILGVMILLFLMLWSKISVGFVALAVTMYYVFRIGFRKIKCWLCNLCFFAVFVFYYLIFQNDHSTSSEISHNSFRLFAFGDYCNSRLGIFGYWFVVSLMSILFICFEIQREHIKLRDFITKKTIWIEIIIFGSFVAFLPGAVLVIEGGSAGYFSSVVIPISMVLLCAKDYFDIKNDIRQPIRGIVFAAAFLWCFIDIIDKLPGNPLYSVKKEDPVRESFYSELLDLEKKMGKEKCSCIIYLDTDAKSTEIFNEDINVGLREVYVYPAITGIGVINATYVHNGEYYTFLDDKVDGSTYSSGRTDHDKLSYEDAVARAKKLGKTHIIHVMRDKYVIDDL